ncbi:DUF5336 domain-containing protein [Solihabitans fulvus]|uniref:DUF5336 domain-containing protein n=1 Tax=Solihabitans fulvus TaxID=1892852 RepID=UPI001661E2E2|nr:DUF5336 domain-containing protein [Solihabitans fulvus]
MSVPYGAPQQQAGGSASPLGGMNLGQLIGFGVTLLALVSYFCAFAGEASLVGITVYVLLAGGLLAALPALPKAPASALPVGALLSVIGALWVLQVVVNYSGSTPAIVVVILIAAILQMFAAVGAVLADAGILKLQPKPAAPYGQPGGWNPQSGGFPQGGPQTGQFGQQPGQQPQQPGQQPQQPGQQPQQFGQQQPPAQPQQPQAPQQTSFMPQPGQFGQPGQVAQPGQPQQFGQPGTPPGGFNGPTQG